MLLIAAWAERVHALSQPVINEIAWMGTSISANAEWIELYNPSGDDISLSGWKLAATDGSPTIALSGTIPANGYFLLERTSDATVPGATANQIYTGALSNAGEHLQLISSDGSVVDDVNMQSGWTAGDDTSKQTMQKSSTGWITATGTPAAQNASSGSSGSGSGGQSGGSGQSGGNQGESEESPGAEANQMNLGKSAREIPIKPDPVYSADVAIPDQGTAGVSVAMKALVKVNNHHDYVTGKFKWSYGDGAGAIFETNEPADHTYYYPGTYLIMLVYYSNNTKPDPDYIFRKEITIGSSSIAISRLTDDGGIVIENATDQDVDLGGWTVNRNGFQYRIPGYSTVPAGASLFLSGRILIFPPGLTGEWTLKNPTDTEIARFGSQHHNSYKEQGIEIPQDESILDMIAPVTPVAHAEQNTIPQELDIWDIWHAHKSILLLLVGIAGSILASLAYAMYANRVTKPDLLDEDPAESDFDLI